ncbi:MAG: restriction endonuclease subunit S [Proteobacteria bacterium]|nr:restriction endonuclease subunit S [Pseudomonadota bacterium]
MEFGDLVVEDNRLINVLDDVEYACGGIRLHGQGIFVREYKQGVDLKKKFVQHEIKEGDIVYSTLFAKAGAFAVAEAGSEGVVLSEKFPTFRLISQEITLDYLKWFFRSGQLNRIAEKQMTGIAAFSLSHLSKRKFLKLKVPVPDIARQEEVVSRCLESHAAVARAMPSVKSNIATVQNLIGCAATKSFASLPRFRISEIGDYVLRAVDIRPSTLYKQVTVAMKNRGLRLRRVCEGSEIKSPGQASVAEGDILFSRIDLWQGAIGIVGKDLEGAVVTRDFPVFRLKEHDSSARELLRYVFMTPEFAAQARDVSRGTTGRKKMKRPAFLEIRIPWCERARRVEVLDALREVEKQSAILSARSQRQSILARQMGASIVSTLYAQDSGLI